MLKRLLDKYWYSVPEMIQIEYMRVGTITFAGGLISPLILKTQGVEFSLMLLGIITLIARFKSLVVVLLKGVSMKTRGMLYIISSALGILGSLVYFIDIYIWIFIQVIYALTNSILLEMYYTEYDIIVAKEYDSYIFKEMQYSEKVIMTFSGALGASLAISLSSNPAIVIWIVITFTALIELPLGIIQYRKL